MNDENLKEWVNQYTAELYQWAFYKTSSKETAEDLVQETFLAAAEKLDKFKGDSTPKTWLFSILNHKVIDFYRKKTIKPMDIDDNQSNNSFDEYGSWNPDKTPGHWHEDDPHLLDNPAFNEVLKKCIANLPEKWSLSIKLKYLTEKNSDVICQELGIAPTNFWQMVHRAKLQLRNCIENNWTKN